MSESDSEDEPYVPTVHWGEIPQETDHLSHLLPDVSEDIKKCMQPDCLNFYPDEDNVMQIQDITLPEINPLVMYSIELHKWMNNMTEKIKTLQSTDSTNMPQTSDIYVPIPPMPEVKIKHIPNNLNFIPVSSLKECPATELDVPELSEAILKQILIKCVAVMTAQIGFEDSYQSVLDVLVDVLEQFYIKICTRFVEALHEEEQLQTGGFPNALERVLVEIGMGGSKGLHNYYQSRVVKYVATLQKRCKSLEQHYYSLMRAKPSSPTGQFGSCYKVRVKKEEDTMETDSDMVTSEGLITNEYELLRNLDPAVDESPAHEGNAVMYAS